MYDNIGKKIKGSAKAVFIIETILGFIGGIAIIATDEDLILAALSMMIVVPLIAWISSWTLYGFGELVEKACEIERNTRKVGKAAERDERKTQIYGLYQQGLITEQEYQQAISNLNQEK